MLVFGIEFEFDRERLRDVVEEHVRNGVPGYVCALDGTNIANAIENEKYRRILNSAIVNNVDSTWATSMTNWIYGTGFVHYCSSDMFVDFLKCRRYRQYFLGSSRKVLDGLSQSLIRYDGAVAKMPFVELPYCSLDEFDYTSIAEDINSFRPDIIWVSLGAPKQEEFMSRLLPYLDCGVMFGVGAVFNFFSGLGDVPKRAPRWMISLHLEFLYRLLSEPRKQGARCLKILKMLPKAFFLEKKKRYDQPTEI